MAVFNIPPGTSCGVSQSFGAAYFAFPFCEKTNGPGVQDEPLWQREGETEKRGQRGRQSAGLYFTPTSFPGSSETVQSLSRGLQCGSGFTPICPLPPSQFWHAYVLPSRLEIKDGQQGYSIKSGVAKGVKGVYWMNFPGYKVAPSEKSCQ